MADVAVIGAGMTGLSAARVLRDAGHAVRVFDKGRGLGGRIATRRRDRAAFDHGAQYVMARGEAFHTYLKGAAASGHAALWEPVVDSGRERPWFVGTPGMSALVKPLAKGLPVERQVQVERLEQKGEKWALHWIGGGLASADAVIATLPPPQARDLLAASGLDPAVLDAVEVVPCWAGLVRFEGLVEASFDVFADDGRPLAWAARDSSKPRRDRSSETWVLHAGPDWSAVRLEETPEAVAPKLLDLFRERAGNGLPGAVHLEAHRWRYARTARPLGAPCLEAAHKLYLAGDWCLGAGVEWAFDSGRAAAERVLADLSCAAVPT